MRKISSIAVLILAFILNARGQNDPKAISILDRFSAKASSASSISIKFIMVTVDQVQNQTDSLAGTLILSKDSYRLDLPDNIIWYNGTTSWSYLPAEQEVTITEPDKNDDSFTSRPSLIFTMYREGFKCRLLEELAGSYIIDLYPTDIKNELIRVRLTISKSSLELISFEYKRRDGVTMTLLVKEYNPGGSRGSGFFEFKPSNYKGVDIIDMR
jgi:outer membrane lipoprotein-sorting protein